jgi:hypothetical protein
MGFRISLEKCSFGEILDAYRKRGIARKKRENLHGLASTNRSFAQSFLICDASRLLPLVTCLTSSCRLGFFFLISFTILVFNIIFLKNNFVVIFNLFSISLFWSHGLDREFCRFFLNKSFLRMIFFIFNFWIILFIL